MDWIVSQPACSCGCVLSGPDELSSASFIHHSRWEFWDHRRCAHRKIRYPCRPFPSCQITGIRSNSPKEGAPFEAACQCPSPNPSNQSRGLTRVSEFCSQVSMADPPWLQSKSCHNGTESFSTSWSRTITVKLPGELTDTLTGPVRSQSLRAASKSVPPIYWQF